VRAGVELIAAVGGLKSSAPLQTRAGIAAGLVVVGDLIGSGSAQEHSGGLRRSTFTRRRPLVRFVAWGGAADCKDALADSPRAIRAIRVRRTLSRNGLDSFDRVCSA
jgi:hypothetical protein